MIKYKITGSSIPTAQRFITENYSAVINEPEKVPDWLNTGITYLLPNLGNNKEVRKSQPITCL